MTKYKIECSKRRRWYDNNADILQDLFIIWYKNLTRQDVIFKDTKNKLFNKWVTYVYIETSGEAIEIKGASPTPIMDISPQSPSLPLIIHKKS